MKLKYIDTRIGLPTEHGYYLGWFGWYDNDGNYRGFERIIYYNGTHWLNVKPGEYPTHWAPLLPPPTQGRRDYRKEKEET